MQPLPLPNFYLQQDDAIRIDPIPGGSGWNEGLGSASPPAAGSSTQLGEVREGAEARKRKRSRVVLSCTMCVRRKSKCDKVVPCSGCVRRGDPAGCVVEGLDEADVPQQPFALNEELVALRHRVLHLESLVQSLPALGGAQHITSASGVFSFAAAAIPHIFHPGPGTGVLGDDSEEESVAAALQRLRNGSSRTSTSGPRSGCLSTGNPELDSLLVLIPSQPICDLLVESFFTRVHWHIHVLHVPTFREELKKFWRLQAFPSDVSDVWLIRFLPTLLIVLALGLHFMPVATAPFSASEGLALPGYLVAATEKALALADWTGTPQARTIQAILLLSFYFHNTGAISRLVVWIGGAVRIAQSLEMHINTKGITFVNDNFEIPPQKMAFFQQELGARLWWWLCTYEWDVSFRVKKVSTLRSQDFSTATLLNLSDEDIRSGPMDGRGLTQPTVATFEILYSDLIFIAAQWSQPRKAVQTKKFNPTLEILMGLDRLVRDIGGRVPEYFSFDKRNDNTTRAIDASKPYIPLQRICLNKEVYSRLARIHRRRMFEAGDSTTACREAAATVLILVREFRDRCDFANKVWWINAHAILVCSILLTSNIHLLSTLPSPLDPEKVAELDLQRAAVQRSITDLRGTPSDPPIQHTVQGLRILDILSAEELAQQQLRQSTSTQVSQLPPFSPERYSRALDLIACNTMCIGPEETLYLGEVADSLLASSPQNAPPPAAAPAAALDPLHSLPFFPTTGAVRGGEEEYDDFFRSVGFLPPVWGATLPSDGLLGGAGGSGTSGNGADDAMAGWRGAFT